MGIICTVKMYSCIHHYVNYMCLVLNGKKSNKITLFWKTGSRMVKKVIKSCISMVFVCTGKVHSCKRH